MSRHAAAKRLPHLSVPPRSPLPLPSRVRTSQLAGIGAVGSQTGRSLRKTTGTDVGTGRRRVFRGVRRWQLEGAVPAAIPAGKIKRQVLGVALVGVVVGGMTRDWQCGRKSGLEGGVRGARQAKLQDVRIHPTAPDGTHGRGLPGPSEAGSGVEVQDLAVDGDKCDEIGPSRAASKNRGSAGGDRLELCQRRLQPGRLMDSHRESRRGGWCGAGRWGRGAAVGIGSGRGWSERRGTSTSKKSGYRSRQRIVRTVQA